MNGAYVSKGEGGKCKSSKRGIFAFFFMSVVGFVIGSDKWPNLTPEFRSIIACLQVIYRAMGETK